MTEDKLPRELMADNIAKAIKEGPDMSVLEVIGVLEMIKTDMLINYGCVGIDGKPLEPMEKKKDE